jgi:hypothetical protein
MSYLEMRQVLSLARTEHQERPLLWGMVPLVPPETVEVRGGATIMS